MNIYDMTLKAYFGVIRLISSRHRKAGLMTSGRKGLLDKLRARRNPEDRYIWIHASSLGEFEQGRPLIEKLKAQHPEYKICLTFFSPSGYKVRKDYPLADIVTYIPYDTSSDLKLFIDILSPEKAIFIKYEIWLNTLFYLKEKNIPTYLISAIFRPTQVFFKFYGSIFREALHCYSWIFVQNEESFDLLKGVGIDRLSIAGDTRTDRVWDIKNHAKDDALVEAFVTEAHTQGQKVMMIGSSWEEDEKVYLPALSQNNKWRAIIVPHEITEKHIKSIRDSVPSGMTVVLHTENPTIEALKDAQILVVDRMGLLSSLYKYTDIAYIGGGFGRGIHNTLEAAVYGCPILFGPNHHKFMEAKALLSCGAAFSVSSTEDVAGHLKLLFDDNTRKNIGSKAEEYIQSNLGSTDIIIKGIFK